MRDDQRGPPLSGAVGRRGDGLLAGRVEVGHRLVHHQDRRVLQQRACDRDALPLPAGHPRAELPGHGVVAVGQLDDELVRLGGPGGRLDLRVGGVGAAEPDVVPQGRVEQERVLRHQGHQPAQVLGRESAHVVTADRDRAGAHVPEPQQQVGAGGLSGPGVPDQGHGLPGADLEGDILDGRPQVVAVGEADPVEAHRRRDRTGGRGVDQIRHRGRLPNQRYDAFSGGGHHRQLPGDLGHLEHGHHRHRGQHDSDGVRGDGQFVPGHQAGAEHQYDEDADQGDRVGRGVLDPGSSTVPGLRRRQSGPFPAQQVQPLLPAAEVHQLAQALEGVGAVGADPAERLAQVPAV